MKRRDLAGSKKSGGELSPKQRRAIAALLASPSIAAAAKAANVGERTLHTWLADPGFARELVRAEDGLLSEVTRRLLSMQESAMTRMHATILDGTVSPAVRLRAAQISTETLAKLWELRGLTRRIEELEKRLEVGDAKS